MKAVLSVLTYNDVAMNSLFVFRKVIIKEKMKANIDGVYYSILERPIQNKNSKQMPDIIMAKVMLSLCLIN
jgi:hypothetical protein